MRKHCWLAVAATVLCCAVQAPGQKMLFDEKLIPRFNIPRTSKPPEIDGAIDPDEWREAAKVMGMARTHGKDFRDRPGSVALALCNYGPDEEGQEETRSGRMKLDLKALGVPAGLSGKRLRIRELLGLPVCLYRKRDFFYPNKERKFLTTPSSLCCNAYAR